MKHIAVAVAAAAALAVIGPHISLGDSQPKATAAHHTISVLPDYRPPPPRNQNFPSKLDGR